MSSIPPTTDAALPASGFRSLTTRLIVWIVLLGGGVTTLTLMLGSRLSRQEAVRAAEREAVLAAEAAVNRAETVLRSIEEGTRVMAATLVESAPSEAELERLLRQFVSGNENVYGSAAAFALRAFEPRRDRFSPYVHRAGVGSQELLLSQLASETYRYWEQDWYLEPALSGRPRWSEPYYDEGGGNVMMVTHSVPVLGPPPERALRAVVTADVHLEWLGRLVRQVRVGRTGYAVLLSREGRILAHPELPQTGVPLAVELDRERQRRISPIVERMLAGGKGFQPVRLPDGSYRLTHSPLGSAGWSLAAVYPEGELMEGVNRLAALQAVLGLAGLAGLALAIVALSRQLTAPLRELADKARALAGGDLDSPLPAVRSRDELGSLIAAFIHMRDSLKAHIRDLQAATAARVRLESELKVARRIQMAMLPTEAAGGPDEGYALAARLVPARAIGGDLFDHFVRDGKVYFLVADVSGKGISAALFMARTKALFEAAAPGEPDPAVILERVNQRLCSENEAGMYVTGVCGILDAATGEVVLAVAGHDPPVIVRREGRAAPLSVEGGPVLGLLEAASFPTNRVRLLPGEALVLYTDGVTEARDASDAFFGPERLTETVARASAGGAEGVTEAVLRVVRAFAGETAQSDDITILTLQYRPSGATAGRGE